jgi:hypothetical protein
MKVAILGFAHGHVGMYCDAWRDRPELGIEVVAAWGHDPVRLADVAGKRMRGPRRTLVAARPSPRPRKAATYFALYSPPMNL